MKRTVVIISNPEDEHTTHVCERLNLYGARVCHFYPENLAKSIYLFLTANNNKGVSTTFNVTAEPAFDMNDVYSIWYRRPRMVALNEFINDQKAIDFSRDEWRSALDASYALTSNPLWVSHPDSLRLASRKPVQLRHAIEIGFLIPKTIISNDPSAIRTFFDQCEGKVVVKATGSGWIYSGTKSVSFVMTNRVVRNDLTDDGALSMAPATFQEEIAKAYELRVYVVGQEVLAIKIDSQRSPISELDWRRYDLANTPYSPYQLPVDIAEKCLMLIKALNLQYGAIDLIRCPSGEYVFLEINGNGQFLWAEEQSGVKVSDALARLLSGVTNPC